MRTMETLLILALVIMGLVFGSSLLIPIAIALLLTTLIAGSTDRFRRLGLPTSLAMFSSVTLVILCLVGVFYILSQQIDALAQAWPHYVARFQILTTQATEWFGPAISAKVGAVFNNLDPTNRIPRLLGSAGTLFSNSVLVTLYVGFMLAERGTITSKLQRVFDTPEKTEEAAMTLNRIVQSIRDYIWIQSVMSVFTAGVSYAVLKMLGVDFAETWALLIFLLNFIPSIGSVLGVLFPAVLALVQFDTTWQFMVIAGLLSTAQFVIGNVIQPAIMGKTLNLSAFVVMVSLAFWATIWGTVGAFLSVPLTAAIVIACSNLPAWNWLAVLLSEDGRTGNEAEPASG